MSKPITIPIKSHTKVRRPESKYRITLYPGFTIVHNTRTPLVQDIKPVREFSYAGYDKKIEQIINETLERFGGTQDIHKGKPKPSILTKLKNRFKK